MARLTPEAARLLPLVDTLIFDVDGVLLDVSRSIRTVNRLVVPTYLRMLPEWTAPDDLLTSEEIERFKTAGGFNDDWDLSCAAVLLFLFKAARYSGRDAAGLHRLSPTVASTPLRWRSGAAGSTTLRRFSLGWQPRRKSTRCGMDTTRR